MRIYEIYFKIVRRKMSCRDGSTEFENSGIMSLGEGFDLPHHILCPHRVPLMLI